MLKFMAVSINNPGV